MKKNSFLFKVLVHFMILDLAMLFTLNGYEWRDLEWQGTYLDTEFATFTTSFGYGTTTCGGVKIPGGYNNMGVGDWMEKTYTGLPEHQTVYITYVFYGIDSLDDYDGSKILIDGTTTCTFSEIGPSISRGANLCGGSWGEQLPINVIVAYPSSSTDLTIRFINNLDQGPTDESTGFRDIKLVFKSTAEPLSCIFVADSHETSYPCSSGFYYSSGSCLTCDPSCVECSGAGNTACYMCSDGYYYTGSACVACGSNCRTCYNPSYKACTSCIGSYYLYPDNSCQASCISPKIAAGGPPYTCACPSGQYLHSDSFTCSPCNFPFTRSGVNCLNPCAPGLYYYANNTCRVNCTSPFTTGWLYTAQTCDFPCSRTSYYFVNGSCSTVCPQYYIVNNISVSAYCYFPCSNPTPYLMDNGTCISTCTFPNYVKDVIVGLECKYQCPTGEYLYLNNTCKPTCPSPFSVGAPYYNTITCNFPCLQYEFYYANGTCSTRCSLPFRSANISVSAYCNFPCAFNQFYYQNNTCRSSCATPFVAINISVSSYCNFLCPLTQYYYSNGSCLSTCPSPFYISSITMGYFCNFPCPTGQYYYANTSCLNSCSSPFVISSITIGNYCNFLCTTGRFYYQNGSCLSTCPTPFISRIDPVSRMCDFPCPSGQFYYANGTCKSNCPPPFSIRTITIGQYCDFPCPINQYYYANTSCLSTCPSPFLITGVSVGSYCNFPCPVGQYYYSDGTCSASCPNPPFTITTITIGQYCNFPCNSREYLYQNNTCRPSCSFPFYMKNDGSLGYKCIYLCNIGEFMYSNKTCLSTCPSPFYSIILPIEKYCNFPCPLSQYLYPDNSCKRTCLAPLVVTDLKIGYLCNFPCSSGLYYYSNTSCLPNCPTPFSITNIGIGSYCNFPCPRNQYLYANKTCLSTCPYPFSIYDVSVGAYCNFPCAQDEYYFDNNTCSKTCSGHPFIPLNISVGGLCKFPCPQNEFYYSNKTCKLTCNTPLYSVNVSVGSLCYFPCPSKTFYYPNSTCLRSCSYPWQYIDIKIGNYCIPLTIVENGYTIPFLGELMKYLLLGTMVVTGPSLIAGSDPYMAIMFLFLIQSFFFLLFFNVTYPPILESILGYFSVARFNFLPNPLVWIVDEIPDLPSPKNFYDNQFTGYFLFTAGPSILIIIGTIIAYITCFLLGYLVRVNRWNRLAGHIYRSLTISCVMRIFFCIFSELTYASLLQTLQFDTTSTLKLISIIFGLFFLSLTAIFPWALWYITHNAKSYKELRKYSIIIEDYDLNKWEKKYFTFFTILRRFLHCLAVTLLYYIPILQTIIPWAINLIILVMLFIYKPHHKPYFNFTDSVYELGSFILHTCIVLLAYYDSMGEWDLNKRQVIGWIMVIDITLLLMFNLFNIWREHIITLMQFCKKTKVREVVKEIFLRGYIPSEKYLTKAKPARNIKLWHFELSKLKVAKKSKKEYVYKKKIKV